MFDHDGTCSAFSAAAGDLPATRLIVVDVVNIRARSRPSRVNLCCCDGVLFASLHLKSQHLELSREQP